MVKLKQRLQILLPSELLVLNCLFAGLLVCSNCIAAKQLNVGTWFGEHIAITVGILTYPFTFLITDIIGEKYGKQQARETVIIGFITQVICILIVTIASKINGVNLNGEFKSVLGSNWILTIGSLTACLISQSWDVFIFHKIRSKFTNKKKWKWLWENCSTITSQLIDSIIFQIGLVIMLKRLGIDTTFSNFVITVFVYWLIKSAIAICDTPIFYLLTRKEVQ